MLNNLNQDKSGEVVHTCHGSSREAEAEELKVQAQLGQVSHRVRHRWLKTKNKEAGAAAQHKALAGFSPQHQKTKISKMKPETFKIQRN